MSRQLSAIRNHTATDELAADHCILATSMDDGHIDDAGQPHVYHIKLFTAVVLDAQPGLTGGIVVELTYSRCVEKP